MDLSRVFAASLFAASCLLSVVSWYTTQQGMALYLSPWFSLMASLGIQVSLVLTAWLIGMSRTRRWMLIGVYAITATVSVAFSYVSLHTWFSARERPAAIQRKLYDSLSTTAAKSEELLAAAITEQQKHVLALDEMTVAERTQGFISKAQDADPYLSEVRDAVAKEARSYNAGYREGGGEGLRYTAFERYAKLGRQSLEKLQTAERALAGWRAQRKPLDESDKQLREFEQFHAAFPWTDIEHSLHKGSIARPSAPAYSNFVDRTSSGQEDLTVAFEELASNPGGRPLLALSLAAFVDIVIFLLAFSAGPHLAGSGEMQWVRAASTVDSADPQLFLRRFLRKVDADESGAARIEYAGLSEGERQLVMALVGQNQAAMVTEGDRRVVALDSGAYQNMLQTLTRPSVRLRAQRAAAASS